MCHDWDGRPPEPCYRSPSDGPIGWPGSAVLHFAAQRVRLKLDKVVDDHRVFPSRGVVIKYVFHMIVADTTEQTLGTTCPSWCGQGMASSR